MRLTKIKLTDGQFAALTDFTFNVGGTNFSKSTLLKVINGMEFDKVPGQFRRWILAGGQESLGLKRRRETEIGLFFDETGLPRALDETLIPIDIREGEKEADVPG